MGEGGGKVPVLSRAGRKEKAGACEPARETTNGGVRPRITHGCATLGGDGSLEGGGRFFGGWDGPKQEGGNKNRVGDCMKKNRRSPGKGGEEWGMPKKKDQGGPIETNKKKERYIVKKTKSLVGGEKKSNGPGHEGELRGQTPSMKKIPRVPGRLISD